MGDDFASTHWSLVLEAARGDSPRAREALSALCSSYRDPLFRFARRKLGNDDEAHDATQDFFTRQVVTGAVFRGATEGRGQFRAWLLAALKNHLLNAHDHQHAAKRFSGQPPASLDEVTATEPPEAEAQYERAWAMTLLARARQRLAELYRGRKDGLELFGVLQQFLPGDEGSLAEAAALLGKTHGAVKTAVSRFRDDYGDAVRAEIALTVSSPSEVDSEIRALIDAVSRNPRA